MTTPATLDAYRWCEAVTANQARNFSYGIRLLPPAKRRALSAVYAMARRIDDIGDGDLPADRKRELLEDTRAALHRLPDACGDPVLLALADAADRMPIPLDAFDELIDGCLADVDGTRYADFDGLVWYCRAVAGSIGRLSLGVFGAADPSRASGVADELGVALQLTNILRDVREDRILGRTYLPARDLERFGCALELSGGHLADAPARLAALIRFEAARAEWWYVGGLRLLPMLDRRSAACAGAMAGIYHALLRRINARPLAAARTRVSLSGWEKAGVALRACAGRTR